MLQSLPENILYWRQSYFFIFFLKIGDWGKRALRKDGAFKKGLLNTDFADLGGF